MRLCDGIGQPVAFHRDAIKRAAVGPTNYVATVDGWQAQLLYDEAADDATVRFCDNHSESYHLEHLEDAIDAFMSYARD